MRYIILAQSDVSARALSAWLEFLGEKAPNIIDAYRIVLEAHYLEGDRGVDTYHRVVEQLEGVLSNCPVTGHSHVVAMVDRVKPAALSAVSDSMTWDHLQALLILTFPEIKWVFGVVSGDANGFPREDHSLPSLSTRARRDPLLDPTGLRGWVRERTNEKMRLSSLTAQATVPEFGGTTMQLPMRPRRELAAAIDDEVDYATIHAYTAYRHGYRADIITTWRLMEERFGPVRLTVEDSHGYALLIEDMRLVFADKPGRVHLSQLGSDRGRAGRDAYCPLLHWQRDQSRWRLLITSGQMGSESELVENNQCYLTGKRYGRGEVYFKPLGGICDIWSSTGLRAAPEHESSERGNAPGFIWPPGQFDSELHDGHGSPGKLGMVALVLVERSKLAREAAGSATDWIKAALLASEAAELLSGRTPTLAVAALVLKHECEVRAECAFIGTGFHFGLEERFEEIQAEVESTCQWFHKRRVQAERDAKAAIVNRLNLVFSQMGKKEEENRCLVELRRLNRLMNRPRGWKQFTGLHWLGWGAGFYGELLLASFARLVTVTAVWIFGIALVTHWRLKAGPEKSFETGSTIIGWFFGGSAAQNVSVEIHLISWLAVVAGVFHIGILMSYLYSLISRK